MRYVACQRTILFHFVDENAISFVLQLYAAGTENTSAALTWALLFMCLHPGVKQRVQQEIDQHIGNVSDNLFISIWFVFIFFHKMFYTFFLFLCGKNSIFTKVLTMLSIAVSTLSTLLY